MEERNETWTKGPWTFGREVTYQHGEWEIDHPGSCSYRHIGAATREHAPIALVTGGLSRAEDVVIDANARLIASAPDLYEAALQALGVLEMLRGHELPFYNQRLKSAEQLRSALLLANTGGTENG